VKPCLLKYVKVIFGEASEAKNEIIILFQHYCSETHFRHVWRCEGASGRWSMASPMFTFQADQSTTYASWCAQLLVFVRWSQHRWYQRRVPAYF